MKRLMKHLLFLAALLLASGAAYAAIDPAEVQKLLADDGATPGYFGWNVAVSGGTAVIGSSGDGENGSWAGSAYVFVRAADGTWSQQAKLTAADSAADEYFGYSVAVDDGAAVVGAHYDDDNGAWSGSAYVFGSASGTVPHINMAPIYKLLL